MMRLDYIWNPALLPFFLIKGLLKFWEFYLLFDGASELCQAAIRIFNIKVIRT